MCDRVAVMNDGGVEQVGPPAEIYHDPETPFVADVVSLDRVDLPFVDDGARPTETER